MQHLRATNVTCDCLIYATYTRHTRHNFAEFSRLSTCISCIVCCVDCYAQDTTCNNDNVQHQEYPLTVVIPIQLWIPFLKCLCGGQKQRCFIHCATLLLRPLLPVWKISLLNAIHVLKNASYDGYDYLWSSVTRDYRLMHGSGCSAARPGSLRAGCHLRVIMDSRRS